MSISSDCCVSRLMPTLCWERRARLRFLRAAVLRGRRALGLSVAPSSLVEPALEVELEEAALEATPLELPELDPAASCSETLAPRFLVFVG
jgi:hypothetical protein